MGAEASALIAEAVRLGNGILRGKVRRIDAGVLVTGEAVGHPVKGHPVKAVGHIQKRESRVLGIDRNLSWVRLVGDVIQPQGVGCASGRALVAPFFGRNEENIARLSVLLPKDREKRCGRLAG